MTSQNLPVTPATVLDTVATMLSGSSLHPKQVESLSFAVLGAVFAAQAGVANIGRAMAAMRGTSPKHGIKQFDRLLSNENINDDELDGQRVAFLLGGRTSIVVTLDWTDYAADEHHRIALNLVTSHGRASPLLGKTVTAKELTNRRNDHEDELLRRLKRLLPKGTQVHVLADRGFGDVKLYELLAHELGWAFTIRFRGCITVESADGTTKTAADWVPSNGVTKILKGAKVTAAKVDVGAVVLVKKKGMKEPWILATSEADGGAAAVSLYSRRFTTEENFRDEKDPRYGMGVLNVRLQSPARRDRLIQVLSIANLLLTLLGGAGEALGLDRQLRANTVRRRTHSLFRQGREYLRGAVGKLADGGRALGEAFLAAVKHCKEVHEVYGNI